MVMIGWTGDTVCYSEKLTPEVAINEHPATCGAVYVSFRVDLCSALRRRQLRSPQAGRQTGQRRKAVIYSSCLIKQSFETPVEECLFDLTAVALSHFLSFYEKYPAMVNQIDDTDELADMKLNRKYMIKDKLCKKRNPCDVTELGRD